MARLTTNRRLLAAVLAVAAMPVTAWAGGGGENMLLLVNPNDESSLRIANAYVSLRNIPERNIVYINGPVTNGYEGRGVTPAEFNNLYGASLTATLQSRGIYNHIDYIGALGQPMSVASTGIHESFTYALSNRTQYERGLGHIGDYTYRTSAISSEAHNLLISEPFFSHTPGSTTPIRHSTQYAPVYNNVMPAGYNYEQRYVAGMIGYSGKNGMTTQQVIDNLTLTAAADGTKPAGTIYFEKSTDSVRGGIRSDQWGMVQQYMTANGIAWVQENDAQKWGNSPKDRPAVRGAVLSHATPTLPNGSTYVPGSYVDTVTSFAGLYAYDNSQTTADRYYVATGAAASSGTILEPNIAPMRFTTAAFYVYQDDGATIGEAWYKSTSSPVINQLQGDILSQAYADVPTVTLTSGPARDAQVSGTLSLSAHAAVSANSHFATGISRMQLYVDGLDKGTITPTDGNGSFNLDTAGLSDGRHEIRIVAYNNAAVESQNALVTSVIVNNKGQSVSATGGTINASWKQQLSIPVSAVKGTGANVTKIELRSLGRVVGTLSGIGGNVSLDASKLAYGANSITPVAILADGTEVRGMPLTVNRDFNRKAGTTPTPLASRNPGFDFEFFNGQGLNTTLEGVSPTGTADIAFHADKARIVQEYDKGIWTYENTPDVYKNGNVAENIDSNKGLLVRLTARFDIAVEGEYNFAVDTEKARWESMRMYIDGEMMNGYDVYNSRTKNYENQLFGSARDTNRMNYLLPGEHTLTLLLSNPRGDLDTDQNFAFYYRDPSGEMRLGDSSFFYTVVPEPGALGLLAASSLLALRRRRVA